MIDDEGGCNILIEDGGLNGCYIIQCIIARLGLESVQ